MNDWTGPGGFIVGVVGVGVSSGAWIWAARANRASGRAEKAAEEARAAVETLSERFEREASENAELLIYRVGPGVNVINKSGHLLRSVAVAPDDESFDWNNLADVGNIPALCAGATNVQEKYPSWPQASRVLVYWLTEDHHRRFNIFPIADADEAHLAAMSTGRSGSSQSDS